MPSAVPPGYTDATVSKSSAPLAKTNPVTAMPPSHSSTQYRRVSIVLHASAPGEPSDTTNLCWGRGSGGVPNEYRISPLLVCEMTTLALALVVVSARTFVPVDAARRDIALRATPTPRRRGKEFACTGAAPSTVVVGMADMASGARTNAEVRCRPRTVRMPR